MYRDIATALYRRAATPDTDGTATYEMPSWAFLILFLDALVFLPIFVVIGYTFSNVFPVIAMIEDPSPPAYEPVSLNNADDNDDDSVPGDNVPLNDEAARGASEQFGQTRAVSSSFRAIDRTLRGIAGWRSYLRGFACWVALFVATMFTYGVVSAVPFVPTPIAALISAIALCQLYTAWTHTVISTPSEKRFWQRMPTFKKAFQASALPTVMYFVALEIQQSFPKWLARFMGMTMFDPQHPHQIPQPKAGDGWKVIVVFIVSLCLTIFLTIPAHVVLTRVQASLLPEEDETIVPFDRSFQGKLEPAIVGGRGFVTVKDAWQTFSRASWVRLVKLYLKVGVASLAAWIVCLGVLAPQLFVIMKYSNETKI